MKRKNVIVIGDIVVDVANIPKMRGVVDPRRDAISSNWPLGEITRPNYILGGAFLVERLARGLMADQAEVAELLLDNRAQSEVDLEQSTRWQIVRSLLRVESMAKKEKDENQSRYRIKELNGFSCPDNQPGASGPQDPLWAAAPKTAGFLAAEAHLVILNDTGNLFRRKSKNWETILPNPKATVVHIVHHPLPVTPTGEPWKSEGNPLWAQMKEHKGDKVVVAVVEDFRNSGARISRQLSWEKTASELLWQLRWSKAFSELSALRWLVVRFGVDGALCWHRPECLGEPMAWLIYDPRSLENKFFDRYNGKMVGYSNALGAAIADALLRDESWKNPAPALPSAIERGVINGLRMGRLFVKLGYSVTGEDPVKIIDYPVVAAVEAIRSNTDGNEAAQSFKVVDCPIPPEVEEPKKSSQKWTILGHPAVMPEPLEAAMEYVRTGKSASFDKIPLGKFGDFETFDRDEIEVYGGFSNLMAEYAAYDKAKKPLSLAVFGPPGSGKSFGIEEIAKTLKNAAVQVLKFNLSQFQSEDQLAPAFHLVRDAHLAGNLPLVFFDEFDGRRGGDDLYWLKNFLAPMQDGQFFEGGVYHPIGRAIFVFAGGIYESYEKFLEIKPEKFKNAKGPDFASRLRGILNTTGIEFREPKSIQDPALLRRALMLRYHLRKKAPKLFAGPNAETLDAHDDVLKAMLLGTGFKHGGRSFEAILEMSNLNGRTRFEPSCIPSGAQLALHIATPEKTPPEFDFFRYLEGLSSAR